MKNHWLKTLIFTTGLVLTSCEDFTRTNLDTVTPPPQPVAGVDLLTGEASRINQGAFTLDKLMANTGALIVSPIVKKLNEETMDLSKSTTQFCQTLGVLDSLKVEQLQELRKPLQEDWKKVMATYHKLAMMNFGPSAAATSTALDSLYTFDGQEKCRLDVQLYQLSRAGRRRLPRLDVINNYNVRGLDSLEPLLFANPSKSRCSRVNPRIAEWFESDLLTREKTVCEYSLHLLKDMVNKTEKLNNAWSEKGGHYTARMLKGEVGTPLEVINKVSQSLFALDTNTKDVKLAYPLGFEIRINGVNQKCPDSFCPENREHPYAEFSFAAMEASLEGFIELFSGSEGFGLDDLLASRGFEDLAQRILTNAQTALSHIKALDENTTFKEAIAKADANLCEDTTSENRLVEACALVWDVRKVTDLLKNDYLSALQELSAPRQAQGDSD